MIIKLKNKDKLIIDEFVFKCTIGKGGITNNKKEGDLKTPIGKYGIGDLYYRKDRIKLPSLSIKKKNIKKNYVWCNDVKSKKYNKQTIKSNYFKFEKLYRKDHKYDLFIPIKYNYKKIIPGKGSAIFFHITKNYKNTAGCIAVSKKDFLIILKLINNNSKFIIS